MSYQDYTKARDKAWEITISQQIKELPLKMTRVCKKMGIAVMSYQQGADIIEQIGLTDHTKKTDGFTLCDPVPIIFYDASCTPARCRFTIAHELGHIVLGHLRRGQATTINREPDTTDDPRETAANIFAARLLAPACILWALNIHSPEQIAALCEISHKSAVFRAERMQLLYEREKQFLQERGKSCFLQSPIERQVFEQFKSYIEKHKTD